MTKCISDFPVSLLIGEAKFIAFHVVFHFYAKYEGGGRERKGRKELGKNRNVKLGEPVYN